MVSQPISIACRARVVMLAMSMVCLVALQSNAAKVCEARIVSDPSKFDGDTVYLPDSAVALSPQMFIGGTFSVVDSITVEDVPPAIFFIIDHSGSMIYYHTPSGGGSRVAPQDQWGARFNVTRDLIDTISKKFPKAEVGVSVFRDDLFFDARDNSLFQAYPTNQNRAYLPLLRLDQMQSNSMTGLQTLREIMQTDTIEATNTSWGIDKYVDLVYQPGFSTEYGTNITAGFNAAKDAFSRTSTPKRRQYIIFLSDGDATAPNDANVKMQFMQGTNVPTTFTVFFTHDGIAPPNLNTMTTNIKENNYSTTNQLSNLWTIRTDYNTLMNTLMTQVISTISQYVTTSGTPTSLMVNNVTSTTYRDSMFIFNNRFPFESATTFFDMHISYRVTSDTAGPTTTSRQMSFTVSRQKGVSVPAGWSLDCWERNLAFYLNGQHVTQIMDTTRSLTLRFTTDNPQEYSSVQVNMTNGTASRDSERYTLVNAGGVWSCDFNLEIARTAKAGDNIMQHLEQDSLVAIFRNPNLPLDTLRVTLPIVESNKIGVVSIVSKDTSGDGYLDRIEIRLDNPNFTLPDNFDLNNLDISFLLDGTKVNFVPLSITTVNTSSGTILQVSLRQDSTTISGQLQTGWQPIVTLSGLEYQVQVIKDKLADDKAGPVIQKAELYLGAASSEYDTLKITFSEDVDLNALRADNPMLNQKFYFYHGDTLKSQQLANATFTDGSGNSNTVSILIPKNAGEVLPYEDLIQLVTGTSDKNRNEPPDPSIARKQPITVVGTNSIILTANPNPFTPGVMTPQIKLVYDHVAREYPGVVPRTNEPGLFVFVETTKPLTPVDDGVYGYATLFDAVGNLIEEGLTLRRGSDYRKYAIFWDGRNRNGRSVGGGTYLLIVELKDIENNRYVKKTKLGIKG